MGGRRARALAATSILRDYDVPIAGRGDSPSLTPGQFFLRNVGGQINRRNFGNTDRSAIWRHFTGQTLWFYASR